MTAIPHGPRRLLVGVQDEARFGLEAPGLTNLSQRLVVFSATYQDIETLIPRARKAMGAGAAQIR